MAYKECPIATSIYIRKQAERHNISVNKFIDLYAEEAEIPKRTLERWVYPKKKTSDKNGGTSITKNKACAISDLYSLIESAKKYSTIYADPPWKYSNQATRSSTDKHYDTMAIQEISDLPIPQLTTEDAHLHLWTANAFIFDSIKIIEAWGFQYKSCFVWVKPQMGIGNYWRVSHEFLLFGLKGKSPFLNRGQMSWDKFDRGTHSKKPRQVADKIELVSPGPYLELFGRETRDNWTVWGNEIEKTLFNEEAFKP